MATYLYHVPNNVKKIEANNFVDENVDFPLYDQAMETILTGKTKPRLSPSSSLSVILYIVDFPEGILCLEQEKVCIERKEQENIYM